MLCVSFFCIEFINLSVSHKTMTIPLANWCSTCEEACHDHSTICTVCGETLQEPPQTTSNNTNQQEQSAALVPSFSLSLGSALGVAEANQEFNAMLSRATGANQRRRRNNNMNNNRNEQEEEEWQTIPAELLNPQTQRVTSRPTSKDTLQTIPRIKIQQKNSILHQPTLKLYKPNNNNKSNGSTVLSRTTVMETMTGLLGEFGNHQHQQQHNNNNNTIIFKDAILIVAEPSLTGKGGTFTSRLVEFAKYEKHQERKRIIIYMERGDGITFVQKAIMAQTQLEADAIVIGNNTTHVWPYVMKDSKKEAVKLGLTIPVIMVKMQDGQCIVQHATQQQQAASSTSSPSHCDSPLCISQASLEIESNIQECVICRDTFELGQTVMKLPLCFHLFHEQCGLAWLCKNNTCPYCRRELPTDDEEYEMERRRQQRTHATGETSGTRQEEHIDFYG